MTGFQKLNAVPEDMARELQKMLREYRTTNGFRRQSTARVPDKPLIFEDQWCYSMMLLEDLSASRLAYAVRLKIDLTGYITDVVVLGWPESSVETVELTIGPSKSDVRGETRTVNVPLNATAEEFRKITGVSGEVSLGAHTVVDAAGENQLLAPARWRIRWASEDQSQEITGSFGERHMVRAEQTLLVGTDKIKKVIQTIPTGWDTPLRAGAICEAVKGEGGIYKVIGAEARFWFGTIYSSGGGPD